MKLQKDKIDTIIMDMDGVITGEMGYWRAAALTVYELMYDYRLYGKQEIDRAWCYKNIELLYDIIFCGGKTISAVKALGVNTNWDLAYVVFCAAKYLEPSIETLERTYFESVCMFLENVELRPPELYLGLEGLLATAVHAQPGDYKRGNGKLWTQLYEVFQRWYHGDSKIPGVIASEEPLLPLDELKETLQILKDSGFRLGIGTGRPRNEIDPSLTAWGLDSYFETDLWATYDEVLAAEAALQSKEPLAKPNPFVFQKAAFGKQFSDSELLNGAVTPEMAKRCLVVGDAASDLLAAKAGGFPFLAVLTGVSGQDARAYFEANDADFILDSVLDMKGLV